MSRVFASLKISEKVMTKMKNFLGNQHLGMAQSTLMNEVKYINLIIPN